MDVYALQNSTTKRKHSDRENYYVIDLYLLQTGSAENFEKWSRSGSIANILEISRMLLTCCTRSRALYVQAVSYPESCTQFYIFK